MTLFVSGVVAALPALLLFKTPVRELLALLVNDSEPSADTSWGFIAGHYPQALSRARAGQRRLPPTRRVVHGALPRRRRARAAADRLATTGDPQHPDRVDDAGAVVALLYVLAAPVFSAFRLELVFLPMAAWGVALVGELAFLRLAAPKAAVLPLRAPARAPRP